MNSLELFAHICPTDVSLDAATKAEMRGSLFVDSDTEGPALVKEGGRLPVNSSPSAPRGRRSHSSVLRLGTGIAAAIAVIVGLVAISHRSSLHHSAVAPVAVVPQPSTTPETFPSADPSVTTPLPPLAIANDATVTKLGYPADSTSPIARVKARLAIPLDDGRILIQLADGMPMIWTGGTAQPTELWSDASWAGPMRLHDAATIDGTTWVLYSVDPACATEPLCSPTLFIAPIDAPTTPIVVATPVAIGDHTRFTLSDTGIIAGAPDTIDVASFVGRFDGQTITDDTPTVPPPTSRDSLLAVDRPGRVFAWLNGRAVTVQIVATGAQQQVPLPDDIAMESVIGLDIVATSDDARRGAIVLSSSTGEILIIDLADRSVKRLDSSNGIALFG